jgi:N-carbamoylputrescine amidase
MRGAEIIFIPTAIGYGSFDKEEDGAAYNDAWQVVQRGHAVANACYLACVNRVGFEENPEGKGGIDFWGKSFVADPNGQVLKEASGEEEELLLCPVDLSRVAAVRDSFSFPFRDRRIDSYDGLTQRYLDSEG